MYPTGIFYRRGGLPWTRGLALLALACLALGQALGCKESSEAVQDSPPSVAQVYKAYTFRCADSVVHHSGTPEPSFGSELSLGPPKGKGESKGSLDVFVLGEGDWAIFAMEGFAFRDGQQKDLKVFENGFRVQGSNQYSWDLGYIEVSPGGGGTYDTWDWYLLKPKHDGAPNNEKSAGKSDMLGLTPVSFHYPDNILDPRLPQAGGDSFDLAEAKKITDRHGSLDPDDFDLGNSLAADGVMNLRYIKVVDGGTFLPDDQDFSNGVDVDAVCFFFVQKL